LVIDAGIDSESYSSVFKSPVNVFENPVGIMPNSGESLSISRNTNLKRNRAVRKFNPLTIVHDMRVRMSEVGDNYVRATRKSVTIPEERKLNRL